MTSALEQQIVDAAVAGDKNKLEKLKAQLAYEQLPDQTKLQYREALDEFEAANAKLNAIIERIPDRSRGAVIEMLKRDRKRLASMGF